MRKPARILIFEASAYHNAGKSIPVSLFEDLCAAGVKPTDMWAEFNADANTNIPLFPLFTEGESKCLNI